MRVLFKIRIDCLALALSCLFLSACAYKNPLIDDGVARKAPTPATAGNPTPAAPAAVVAASPAASAAQAPTPQAPAPAVAASPAPAAAPAAASASPTPVASASAQPAATQTTQAAAPAMAASGTGAGLETIKENRRFSFLRPYRADVQQGNFISGEMVSQLKPGMTPEQVRFVLGTPLLTDIFHRDQWTYAFDMRRGNGETTRGRLTLYFSDNRLERWEGGDLPGEEAYLARISGAVPGNKNKVDDVTPAPARAPSAAKESRY